MTRCDLALVERVASLREMGPVEAHFSQRKREVGRPGL
jgi:hypothetical protein